MKKILAMVMALALCVCAAVACAETTVESKVIEAYGLELNTKANTLVLTDGKTYDKYVVDTEGNKLSDSFAYISSNDGFYTVGNEDLHLGLLDGQGKQLLPLEYGEIKVYGTKWIAGIKLVVSEDSEENPDYKSLFGGKSYMIDSVDVYYAGEKKATLTRAEWDYAKAFGDYIAIEDREGKQSFYNKDFVKSPAEASYAYEYNNDYSTKTVTHLGSGQAAFTADCTLTADEVLQSVWVNSDKQLLDLQGNVLADFSDYKNVQVDAESNLIKLENADGKVGLADSTGKVIIPCAYDRMSYALAGAQKSGYLYVEKDGKNGFVSLTTGEETGFTFMKDAGDQRANFILVNDAREGKILISAMAGELPGRYKETNAGFPAQADGNPYAIVKEMDDTCRVVGQKGEEVLPGVTFSGIYDAKISDDGTLILLPGERGSYTLYKVSYNP